MGILDNLATSLSGGQGSPPPDSPAPQGGDISQLTQPSGGQIPQSGANNAAMNPQPQQPQGQQQIGPQLHGIKGYLSNIFYNMGEAAKAHLGMPTDVQVQQNQQKIDIEKQRTGIEQFKAESEAQYRQTQTAANAMGPIMDPKEAETLGLSVGDMVSPAQKLAMYKIIAQNKGKTDAAQIGANARLGAAQIQALSRMSQTSMRAAYAPDGTMAVGLYDKAGNFRGYAENAIVPAEYLERIKHGEEFKVDIDGHLQSIPTTSTTQPLVPPAKQQPNKLIQGPETPNPSNIKNILSQGAAQAGQVANQPITPAAAKTALQNGAARGGINAKPVMVNGQPFQTATANDTVYALDPKTNLTVATTRSDAGAKGLQITANKVNPSQVRKDESLSNRVADVQRKVGDYADSFSTPIDSADKTAISYLMDHNIGGGLSAAGMHMSILPGYVQSQLQAAGIGKLSEAGMRRFIQFNQARESLSGYQQVLTNSSRSSDKILELQLEQLPPPIADSDYANMATGEFQKNIDLAGQHIPMFPGSAETQQSIKAAQMLKRQQNQAAQNNQNNPQQYINQNKTGPATKFYQGVPYTQGPDGQWHKASK